MEFREDKVIPLRVWQDELMGVSFIDVLGQSEIYSVKLPSTIANYKLGHLINPEYLLDIELVKTRKNWVLKNAYIAKKLTTPKNYDEHIKLSEMIKTLVKLSHTDQKTELQQVLLAFFEVPLSDIRLSDFEAAILDEEGFLHSHLNTTQEQRVSTAKNTNNLQ